MIADAERLLVGQGFAREGEKFWSEDFAATITDRPGASRLELYRQGLREIPPAGEEHLFDSVVIEYERRAA